MLSAYTEQQPAIIAAFHDKRLKQNLKDIAALSDSEFKQAEELVELLKPIKTVTTIMCEEKSPTISLVHPMRERLMVQLSQTENDTQATKQFKGVILDDISSRYVDKETNNLLEISCALDPRFKGLPYHSDDNRARVYENVLHRILGSEMEVVVKQEQVTENEASANPSLPDLLESSQLPDQSDTKSTHPNVTDSPGPSPQKKAKSAMEDLFGDVLIVQEEPAKPITDRAKAELERYRAEPGLHITENPLVWWKDKERSYPLLSKLAKSVLSIQGTSVPSERVFSTAGDIVSSQRAALSPHHVDVLIFLKKNMEL